ncbi:MAG: TetR/AcrR family transcriptional regulator [Pseudomonadota bacterium]|nr:TetR/AcrR family transcriptional regulator [Pseudomonadota bacterium]
MARPRSDEKRSAILAAAVRAIDRHGPGAPTALIAKEAGVANGSLFTYFQTKSALFNALYLELKRDMAAAALAGLPAVADLPEQLRHVWSNWMEWAVRAPQKRQALARLGVCDEVTVTTRAQAQRIMEELAYRMKPPPARGSMREAPLAFVAAVMNSVAETTMDFMLTDPAHGEHYCQAGFEAVWRMLS